MKRVAIYLRVSDPKQEEKGVSLDVQREHCLRYLREQPDWIPVLDEASPDPDGIFQDVTSGLETEKRAAYQRLLAACRQKRVDIILVFRYDRLGRDDAELITRGRELGRLKVKLLSVTEGERDDFMLNLGFLLARRESAELSKRVTPAMRKRAEQGLWMAKPPYGYRMAEGQRGILVVYDPEAEVVRELFRRAAIGESIHGLANWLNGLTTPDGERLRSPRGKYFSTSWVRGVLTNTGYIGMVHHGMTRQSRIDGTYDRPLEEQYHGEGRHEAIIDRDTFDRVQAAFQAHPHFRKRATARLWLLTGMVRCGVCGRVMQGRWVRRPKQRRQGVPFTSYMYYCQQRGHCSPGGRRLDTYVLDTVARLSLDGRLIEDVRAILEEQQDRQPDRVAELGKARARLERRLKDATELLLDGTLSREVYRRQREEMEAGIAEIDAALAAVAHPAGQSGRIAEVATARLRELGDLRAVLACATLEQRAEIVAGAIKEITYRKDTGPAITWQPWAQAAIDALEHLDRRAESA